ncbi:MAG: hypothetical protein WAP35_00760 [Solirubrobacterales bacterium]
MRASFAHRFADLPLADGREFPYDPPIDLDTTLKPIAEALLEPDEPLIGYCVGTRTAMFSGGAVAVIVSERRLIVQPLDRKMQSSGDAISMTPDQIADVSAGGGGGGWWTASAAIMDNVSVELKLRTTDGEKLKLLLMRGEGRVIGKLGGGETQRQGVQALARWFGQHAPQR